MRKLLLFMAVVPLTFMGCLNTKEDPNVTKLKPVLPGINIYNGASLQNQMALQPSEVALRLAMLMDEAVKQGGAESLSDLNNVIANNVNVKNILFGTNTTILKEDNGYKITYVNSKGMARDDYYREGVFFVTTNDIQLLDTNVNTAWSVSMSGEVRFRYGAWNGPLTYIEGGTTLYHTNDEDLSIRINISGIVCYFNQNLKSNWSGGFTWTTKGASLAYSDCAGKESTYDGEGSGVTFNTYNNASAANMWYQVREGRMMAYRQIGGGTETCRLTSMGDYDPSLFPSPLVSIEWNFDTALSYIINYNGHIVSVP